MHCRRIVRCVCAWLGALLLQGCASILYVDDGAVFHSHDGHRTAKVDRGRVILDGVAQAEQYDGIYKQGVIFSADGKRVAYVGMRGTAIYPVIDGKQYGPFEAQSTLGIMMSPRSTHVLFTTVEKDRWRYWDNGTPGPVFDGIAGMSPAYSADDSQVAYAARRGDRWIVVANGVEYDADAGVGNQSGLTFTARNEVAYDFTDGKRWAVRIGSWRSEMFDVMQSQGLVLSPNGETVSYVAKRDGRWRACFNQVCERTFDTIGSVGIVPPGMFDNFGRDMLLAVGMGVVGGVTGATVPTVVSGSGSKGILLRYMAFSRDGRHHAYVGDENKKSYIVLDGNPVATLAEGALLDSLRFSEDAGVLTYHVFGAESFVAVPLLSSMTQSPDAADAGTLSVTTTPRQSLVFIDGRFAGPTPLTANVEQGEHTVRVESPGYLPQETRTAIERAATSQLAVELAPTPIHRALRSVLTPSTHKSVLVYPQIPEAQYWRARGLCQVPLDQDVFAIIESSGGSCLVFSESQIYVYNNSSTSSPMKPQSYRLSYEDLRTSAVPQFHNSFEATLAGKVVFNMSNSPMPKDELLALMAKLRAALADNSALSAAR